MVFKITPEWLDNLIREEAEADLDVTAGASVNLKNIQASADNPQEIPRFDEDEKEFYGISEDQVNAVVARCLVYAQHNNTDEAPSHVDKHLATRLVALDLIEHKIQPTLAGFDKCVAELMIKANKVLRPYGFHCLTAGELVNKLKDLPENTPIVYQRIEDLYFEKNGWKTHPVRWETMLMSRASWEEMSPEDKKEARLKDPNDTISDPVEVVLLSNYIPAFGVYVTEAEEGGLVVCIHAHY